MNIALIALSRPLSLPLPFIPSHSHPSPPIVWPSPARSSPSPHPHQLQATPPPPISSSFVFFFFSSDVSGGHKFTRGSEAEEVGRGVFAVYLSNNHHHGAENSRDTGGGLGGEAQAAGGYGTGMVGGVSKGGVGSE